MNDHLEVQTLEGLVSYLFTGVCRHCRPSASIWLIEKLIPCSKSTKVETLHKERWRRDIRAIRAIRAIAAKRDEDIVFSDTPAVVDWSGAKISKLYRPTKKPVTMRLDSDVIAWLKADGRG